MPRYASAAIRRNWPPGAEVLAQVEGDILRVVATDPGSVSDMAAFSRRTGNEIVEQSEGGGEYTFLFRKG